MEPNDFHSDGSPALSPAQRWDSPIVQELAWVLQAPPLIVEVGCGCTGLALARRRRLYRAALPQLAAWDAAPAALEELVAARRNSDRLGHRFEALVVCLLEALLGRDKVLAGLQVHGPATTLGECDLITRWPRDDEHWELAYKFYCCDGPPEDPAQWRGVQRRDSLGEKLHTLSSRQLRLAAHPRTLAAARERLPGLRRCRALAWLGGWLFYRPETPAPSWTHPGHARGFWLRSDEMAKLQPTRRSARYLIVPKERWLAPARSRPEDTLLGLQELPRLLQSRRLGDAALVAECLPGPDRAWQECRRLLVLPKEW